MSRYHLTQGTSDGGYIEELWFVLDTKVDDRVYIGPRDKAYEMVTEYNRLWEEGDDE